MTLAQRITRAKGGDWTGKQGLIPGPGHSAKDRSMAIADNASNDDVVCYSFAGDDPLAFKDTLRAEGLLPTRSSAAEGGPYIYRNVNGSVAYRIARRAGKKFVAETPTGGDGWCSGMNGAKPIPYRLPQLIESDPEQPVFICEGEKDADNLARLGCVATTNPFGAGKWPAEFSKHLAGRDVIILPDNDRPGRDHAEDVARKVRSTARGITILPLPGLPDKGDVSDWIAAGGTVDKLFELIADAPAWSERKSERLEADVTAPARKFGSLTASALNLITFAPLQYVIPDLLPEGLAILAGKPKFGKSFAALDIGIAVASGGKGFGSIPCEAGDVLYCALEDSPRRLQDRIRGMLPLGDDMPERLHIETMAKRLDEGLIDDLSGWLFDHPYARLIILDTWRCIKPAATGRASAYDEDASGLNPLHELAKAHPGVAILVIHHTRKLEADDPFDTISGTHGLTGVADTLLVLAKHGEGAKLCGQGRDIDGYEKALTRNKLTGSWRITGDAKELAKTGERQALLDVLKEAEGEVLRTSAIAKGAGVSESSASHRLKALHGEGLVEKAGYGKWKLPDPYQCRQSRQSDDDTDDDTGPYFDNIDEIDGGSG
jgi:hypothetical protein